MPTIWTRLSSSLSDHVVVHQSNCDREEQDKGKDDELDLLFISDLSGLFARQWLIRRGRDDKEADHMDACSSSLFDHMVVNQSNYDPEPQDKGEDDEVDLSSSATSLVCPALAATTTRPTMDASTTWWSTRAIAFQNKTKAKDDGIDLSSSAILLVCPALKLGGVQRRQRGRPWTLVLLVRPWWLARAIAFQNKTNAKMMG
jgi:hypothetical protein